MAPFSDMNLEGAVAIVTGGGTGIGRAVCEGLGSAGAAAVVVNYSRSAEDAEATAKAVRAMGCEADPVQADVSDEAAVRRMIGAAVDRHGRIDVLVNNAGTTRFIPYPDLDALTDEVWDEILSVNLRGAFYCARAAAPSLKRARGAIVNVTSIAGVRTGGSSLAYAVSKAALTQLTKGLAVAVAPEVRVNSVAPGLVATRWHIGRIGEDGFAEQAQQAASATPLREVAAPQHVAQAVLAFLQADLVTGESMIVDGGKHLSY